MQKEIKQKNNNQNILLLQWHPAFFADVRLILTTDWAKLNFVSEYQLGTKPKEIDVLIIKKKGTEPIQKSIGKIFREHNIVEYKAPGDYFSIDDYYKVYGYACFYKADANHANQVEIQDITISLFSHSYPRKLIKHLVEDRGCEIEKIDSGIYYVHGEYFPIQIIITRELDKKEYFWLKSLTNNLKDRQEANELLDEYAKHQNDPLYSSVMDVIVRANRESFEEENMCEALEEILAPRISKHLEEEKNNGKIEGRAQQIVEMGMEFKLSLEDICHRLQKTLDISEQKAEEYMKLYGSH